MNKRYEIYEQKLGENPQIFDNITTKRLTIKEVCEYLNNYNKFIDKIFYELEEFEVEVNK